MNASLAPLAGAAEAMRVLDCYVIKAGWSEVVNQCQCRADLVPNLVNTVKGEASLEQAPPNSSTAMPATVEPYSRRRSRSYRASLMLVEPALRASKVIFFVGTR